MLGVAKKHHMLLDWAGLSLYRHGTGQRKDTNYEDSSLLVLPLIWAVSRVNELQGIEKDSFTKPELSS